MLKICLVFWESEPQYAYKRYAYKKKHVLPPTFTIFMHYAMHLKVTNLLRLSKSVFDVPHWICGRWWNFALPPDRVRNVLERSVKSRKFAFFQVLLEFSWTTFYNHFYNFNVLKGTLHMTHYHFFEETYRSNIRKFGVP